MRLIDADALKSKIREQPWKQETKVSLILEWIYMLIDEASTVSTVQNEVLQQENERLDYTLIGVMHFVDKWLDDTDGMDEVNRSAKAREVALQAIETLEQENEQLRAQIGEVEDKGKISDGYHTFNELYYHRMILFSVICNHHKDIAWKSWKHADGTMFDDYFIVGITTPKGDYTYHYQKQYWNIFDVKELEFAPEWDGHQPKDIDRLLSIFPDTDYHNPADVEALIKAREAIKAAWGDGSANAAMDKASEALAAIDKAIGG